MKTPHWSTMSQDRLNCCALMSIENDILREIDFTGIITEFASGLYIKYVMLFLANFDPPPSVTLCYTSRDPPKVRHTSRTPPQFLVGLVQKTWTKAPCTNSLLIVCGVFVQGALSGVVSVHSLSVRIHLLQQKGKHHFKLHVSYV